MKILKIIKDTNFIHARLIIYTILFAFYIYLAYFSNFKCVGCPLCGMTRAIKSLLSLNFELAFYFNKNVWIFCIIIPIIIGDIIINILKKVK